jgi:hypothetical protein
MKNTITEEIALLEKQHGKVSTMPNDIIDNQDIDEKINGATHISRCLDTMLEIVKRNEDR